MALVFFELVGGRQMKLFHRTTTQDAESIWKGGFRDEEVIEDDGCSGEMFLGVRLLDNSIGWNPNPDGNTLLLAIEIPVNEINGYEWEAERRNHWLIELETREFLALLF